MTKYTQHDLDSFKVDSKGFKICPSGDYTAIKVFPKKCAFGEWSTFGDSCTFGELCKFSEGCIFGEGCNFGMKCHFGWWCSFGKDCSFTNTTYCGFNFSDKCKIEGTQPYPTWICLNKNKVGDYYTSHGYINLGPARVLLDEAQNQCRSVGNQTKIAELILCLTS